MSEDKNQQKTGKQLLNDTQEAAERAHLLRQMNPTSAQLETELKHEKRKHSYNRALRSTLYTLLVVAAVAVLIATMVMPILQITGTSMTPVVGQGEITMVVRGSNPQRGDIIAFYYNNKVLIKRVIGLPGEWVNIDGSGNVYINGELLDEPYITDRWATAPSRCRTKCRTGGILFWVITAPPRATAEAHWSAQCPKSRLWGA